MNEDGRSMDLVRIQFTGLSDFFHFGNGDPSATGGVGIEVACCPAIDKVAVQIGLPRLDQRKVGYDAALKDVGLTVEVFVLFAFGNEGADSRPRVEAGNTCPARSHAFSKGSLGTKLDFDFAGEELAFKLGIFSHVAGDHLLDLVRSQKKTESRAIDAGVVAGDGQVANPGIAQGEDEFLRNAAQSKATDCQKHSVVDYAFQCGFRVGEELIHSDLQGRTLQRGRPLAPVACFTGTALLPPSGGIADVHGKGWVGAGHRFYDWTLGCIAVTNEEIDEVWKLVPVGTPVEIRQ